MIIRHETVVFIPGRKYRSKTTGIDQLESVARMHKGQYGCLHCYMYRRDESIGKDPSIVQKTENFDLPVKILRSGKYKGRYKIPFGSHIWTCFSSDFFHADADEWREDAWDMIHERSDCSFFMITKRPERIADHLPKNWGYGWEHVTIAVTCENQEMADKRLPVYLSLPLFHHSVMIEPMLTAVDLQPYIKEYRSSDGGPMIKHVSVGGESGPGAKLIKDGKLYDIPRKLQHTQAHKAGLDT